MIDSWIDRVMEGELPARRWKCEGCGEMLGPPYSDCWKCGAARPGLPPRAEEEETSPAEPAEDEPAQPTPGPGIANIWIWLEVAVVVAIAVLWNIMV